MAKGTRIGSAVMFVQQLDRSVSFYTELLAMQVADQSPTAALLVSPGGTQLILRAMGSNAGHPLGGGRRAVRDLDRRRGRGLRAVRAGAQGALRATATPAAATG